MIQFSSYMKKESNTFLSPRKEYVKSALVALLLLSVFFVYSADVTYSTKSIDEEDIFVNSQTINLID